MSEGALWAGCFALLLVGTSIMLWAAAARQREREASRSFMRAQTEQALARYQQPDAVRVSAGASEGLYRTWHDALHRAGIEPGRRFYLWLLAPLAVFALGVWIQLGMLSALVAVALYALGVAFWLWNRARRVKERLLKQLPGFLDGVVRMMSIGSAVSAAFQAASANTEPPLHTCLATVAQMQRTGKDLDAAMQAVGQQYRINELILLSSVLRLSLRYGGRADIVMERTAAFMRDQEQSQQELLALSAETRLSAWILGLLPVLVGGVIVMFNSAYILSMWRNPMGQMLMLIAFALQLTGAAMLVRLAKSL